MELRLRRKQPTGTHPVDASHERLVEEHLEGVRVSATMELRVAAHHVVVNPRAVRTILIACAHHRLERGVHANVPRGAPEGALESP